MDFSNHKAIYLQIAELICEKILLGQFREDERIPSVRELAVQIEVNPNTVMRTYEFLQTKEILCTKRGVGFFVAGDGKQKSTDFRKDEFLQNELPKLFKTAILLNISFDELKEKYFSQKNDLPIQ